MKMRFTIVAAISGPPEGAGRISKWAHRRAVGRGQTLSYALLVRGHLTK
jgi:hypothetical protein